MLHKRYESSRILFVLGSAALITVSYTHLCVDCQRCVCLCPTHALKVIKSDNTFKINANWTNEAISDIIRQAGTGAVLLSAMGTPKEYPVYWDKILINASQVTNPSIDPVSYTHLDVYKRQAINKKYLIYIRLRQMLNIVTASV